MGKIELYFLQPSASWNEALPLGNGRLGGMVYGNAFDETISLNEDSIWYGGFTDRNNPDAYMNLSEVRRLIFAGDIPAAERLALLSMCGTPDTMRHYEPLGDLKIRYTGLTKSAFENHRRSLDLRTGLASVSFTVDGGIHEREAFVSFPAQVMAVRIKAENAQPFLAVNIDRQHGRYVDTIGHYDNKTVLMEAKLGGGGVEFTCGVRVVSKNAKIVGESITAGGFGEVILYLAAATTYRFDDPRAEVLRLLDAAEAKGYEALRQEHITDFSALMDRVSFTLPADPEAVKLPTDKRLARIVDGGTDEDLIALYYQYGRYLTAAGSRPGSLPLNLQGIWNPLFLPPWDSKFTININTEMNYWLTESAALGECHEPLFDLIERMRANGRRTAQLMYRARGFVAHHNTDIWGDCAPQDKYAPASFWPMGAAWLCLHIWEHYRYTMDEEFLKTHYLAMREAAEFFLDYLVEDKDGQLVTCPSSSPENTYILPDGTSGCLCFGPSIDSQILNDLFDACIEASKLLDVDADYRAQFISVRSRLPRPSIGKHGQLMEWSEDYDEKEPGHRHMSHLYALYPGLQISPGKTPELAKAARVTLDRRLASGGGHTGWSRAWIISMWARLLDGEKAYENILALLRVSTLPNLFDNHPPFQIDGNFGGAAGVTELLVQSDKGSIELLPALPKAWHTGSVRGLRARGGISIDMEWTDGKLINASLRADKDTRVAVNFGGSGQTIDLKAGESRKVV